jgi:hypothetical protein
MPSLDIEFKLGAPTTLYCIALRRPQGHTFRTYFGRDGKIPQAVTICFASPRETPR